jgi:hypothetical protein
MHTGMYCTVLYVGILTGVFQKSKISCALFIEDVELRIMKISLHCPLTE